MDRVRSPRLTAPPGGTRPGRVAAIGGKALVKVGYGCNQRCSFCHTEDQRSVEASAGEIHAKIERAAALGHRMVVLSGGEPTARPELLDWGAHVAGLGMELGLVTNGLLLADPALVAALLRRQLGYVQLSLHGGTAGVHDGIVRREAFAAARAAIGNLSGRGLHLVVNCVVTRENVDVLGDLVRLSLDVPDLRVKFTLLQPKGGGLHGFDELAVPAAEASAKVLQAIRAGEREVARLGTAGPSFLHEGFPLCLLPGLEGQVDDLRAAGFVTMAEAGEPDFFPVDDLDRVQPEEACGGCALRGACPGLDVRYLDRFGTAAIGPPGRGPRPNSFNFVLRELVATDADPGSCPLRDGALGVTPWDRGRQLFVRHGPRVARYEATTRDFRDAEISAVKHGTGQVYLDVSAKEAPDDFARDLVPLRRGAVCVGCPEEGTCTGLFEARLDVNLFLRDDARLREVVASLEGDVLDVGCGEGPYGGELGDAARAGRLRYVGLDPDAARIGRLRASRPWANVIAAEAEALDDVLSRDAAFDHVLVLRSWNHLRAPGAVLRAIDRRLRTGATVTLADNVAFGLARNRGHARSAEASGARLEHWRNDGAAEVVDAVRPVGWELLERRDVGPDGSNQWLLRFRKAPVGVLR